MCSVLQTFVYVHIVQCPVIIRSNDILIGSLCNLTRTNLRLSRDRLVRVYNNI